MLTSTDIDDKVYTAIIGQWPVDLVTEKSNTAGEEEFASRPKRQVAGRSGTQCWLVFGIGVFALYFAVTATRMPAARPGSSDRWCCLYR